MDCNTDPFFERFLSLFLAQKELKLLLFFWLFLLNYFVFLLVQV